jgi:DNA-binding phage protein
LALSQVFGVELPQTEAMAKVASGAGQHNLPEEALSFLLAGGHGPVLPDLEKMASLEAVKAATAGSGDYPLAEPFGDLKRARWQVEKLAEEAQSAVEINEAKLKEAQQEFHSHLKQHFLSGGGMGEIAHALSGLSSPGLAKAAMKDFAPELQKLAAGHRVDLVRLQSDMIRYEMDKTAHRVANPENPIVQSFAGYVKLARHQRVLARAHQDLSEMKKRAHQLQARAAVG